MDTEVTDPTTFQLSNLGLSDVLLSSRLTEKNRYHSQNLSRKLNKVLKKYAFKYAFWLL